MPAEPPGAVLHYVGYDVDRGGILAVIRAVAAENEFPCVLGVNPNFQPERSRAVPLLRLPAIAGDTISAGTLLRARRVAREVVNWLAADPTRVFHGHSRAGLLVALWLKRMGEKRVAATVHCYGRRRWFYRWAAGQLRGHIFWLSPAMRRYYGGQDQGWDDCLPPCIPIRALTEKTPRRESRAVCFGCVGALVPVKQWELVLQAFAQIPRDVPLRIIHAGSDDGTPESRCHGERLRRQSAQPDIAGRFEWRGEVSDMPAFFRELDCLIVPSRWEAFSVAALEAAAAHVPCLAADGAGNRDLVETARAGWLFAPDSADDLASKLIELAQGAAWKMWGRDDAALLRFTAPVVAAQHVQMYRRLSRG